MTTSATWSVDDPSVARIIAPGTVVATGVGNTVVRAHVPGIADGNQTIAVFDGTTPLPTFTVIGFVYEGSDRTAGAINGATAEVIQGLITGTIRIRVTAISRSNRTPRFR